MEECLLACSLWFAKIHDHLPRVVIIHNDLGPSTSVMNQEIATTDLSLGQTNGIIFSVVVASFQLTLVLVKLTKKKKEPTQLPCMHNITD